MVRLFTAVIGVAAIAAAFNLLDLVMTILGLSLGLQEGNPSSAFIIQAGRMETYSIVKIFYSVAIVGAGAMVKANHSKVIKSVSLTMLAILSGYFGVTLVENLMLLIR